MSYCKTLEVSLEDTPVSLKKTLEDTGSVLLKDTPVSLKNTLEDIGSVSLKDIEKIHWKCVIGRHLIKTQDTGGIGEIMETH